STKSVIVTPTPALAVITPALISFLRLVSGVIPCKRSISAARRTLSSPDISISATQVFDQSNLSPCSRDKRAVLTAPRFAPHALQNFRASLWVEPQFGQNIPAP